MRWPHAGRRAQEHRAILGKPTEAWHVGPYRPISAWMARNWRRRLVVTWPAPEGPLAAHGVSRSGWPPNSSAASRLAAKRHPSCRWQHSPRAGRLRGKGEALLTAGGAADRALQPLVPMPGHDTARPRYYRGLACAGLHRRASPEETTLQAAQWRQTLQAASRQRADFSGAGHAAVRHVCQGGTFGRVGRGLGDRRRAVVRGADAGYTAGLANLNTTKLSTNASGMSTNVV